MVNTKTAVDLLTDLPRASVLLGLNMEPKTGDVYSTGGGRRGYWLVVAITVVLGLDLEFNIVSGNSYNLHYFAKKEAIGHIDLKEVRFT